MSMKKCLSTLTLAVGLTACADNPLMQSPAAVNTDPVDAMQKELDAAVANPQESTRMPPPAVTQALLPPLSGKAPVARSTDERFNLSVQNVPARQFFMGLVKGTPYNMVVHPEVTGDISLDLKNVTIEQVMQIVRNNYGYDYKYSNGLYQVLPGGLRTEIYPINYLNIDRKGNSEIQVSAGQVSAVGSSQSGSSNSNSNSNSNNSDNEINRVIGTRITTSTESAFWSQLRDTLQIIIGNEQGRSVVTTPDAGIVIVRAMSDELKAVKDYLQRTQLIMQRQVILEAKILEVLLNKGYEQGIDWSYYADYTSKVDANGDPVKSLLTTLGAAAITNEGVGGVFGATLRINDFNAFIQLLGKQGNVQVLSSPRIATVNNQKAVIKVGSDEFFVTDVDVDETNNTNTNPSTNTSVTLTPFFSGIALDVTPQISDTGEIILHVHPSVSEVKDQTKIVSLGDRDLVLPLALSTIRETDSVIAAQNGQIVVIGGLIQSVNREDNAEVPFFSRIPLLGEAFKQKRQTSQKSELVILLKPIIADAGVVQQDISGTRERFRDLQRQLAVPRNDREE